MGGRGAERAGREMSMLETALNAAARVIEAIAAVMIAASVAGGVLDLVVAAARGALVQRTTGARLRLAERLVVSIEFLIAADILKTVVTPTLEGSACSRASSSARCSASASPPSCAAH